MRGSGSKTRKPVPAPRRGRKPKEPGGISWENVFVARTRKEETFLQWVDLLKNKEQRLETARRCFRKLEQN